MVIPNRMLNVITKINGRKICSSIDKNYYVVMNENSIDGEKFSLCQEFISFEKANRFCIKY